MKENYSAVNMMILQEKGYFGHDDASLIVDGDPHFIINPISREIVNNSKKTDLIQFDHNSERITFECPHFIEGHDMTFCNKVVIDYSVGESKGVYEVNDLTVKENDSDTVVFTWLISSNVTTTLGKIKFALTFKCVLPDGTVTYKWGTKRNDTLQCLETEQGNAWVAYDYPDILEQWKTKIFDARDNSVKDIVSSTNNGVSKIVSEGKSQVQAINTAGITVKNEIEKKASDTLATIPEDYTQLDRDVSMLKSENVRYSARFGNALIKKVTSDKSVTITDSADAVLHNLQISGKSEQVLTTGAQLLPQPQFNDTKNGITVKTQTDGGISITGTATAAITFTVAEILLQAGQYTLSGLSGLVVGKMYFQLVEISAQGGQFVGELAKVGHVTSATVTIDHDVWARAEIKVLSGVTADSVCYPMLNFGDTALPWEPYSGGAPSPSPDYPQDIISVGTVSTGAQLFDIKNLKAASSGTWQVADNGKKITVIGTNAYSGAVCNVPMDLVRGKTITLSGTIDRTNAKTPILQCSITSADGVTNYYVCAPKTTVTLKDDDKSLQIYLYANNTLTSASSPQTAVFSDVMLNYGHTPLPWELYTGGKPSPSVEYPAELEVGVTGTQLFDASTIKSTALNGVTFTNNGDGSITVKGTATAQTSTNFVTVNLEPGQYRISGGNAEIKIIARVQDGETINYYSNNKFEVTISSNINIYMQIDSGKTVNSTVWPMLNAGDQPLPWEPYKGHQTATITLTEPLRSIGEYRDRIMCRDGVWGIERQIGEKALTGNESVYIYTNETLIVDTVSFIITGAVIGDEKPAKCTHSDFRILRYRGDRGEGLTSFVTITSTALWTKAGITPETFKAFLKEQYDAGTPVTISYLFATPTWEPLPSATQQALNELTTYAGTTHLTITAGGPAAGIEAEYVQDINSVIAELLRQIEELRNAHTK